MKRAHAVLRAVALYQKSKRECLNAVAPSALLELAEGPKPHKGTRQAVLGTLLLLGYEEEKCRKWSDLTHHLRDPSTLLARLGGTSWHTLSRSHLRKAALALRYRKLDSDKVSKDSACAGHFLQFVGAATQLFTNEVATSAVDATGGGEPTIQRIQH